MSMMLAWRSFVAVVFREVVEYSDRLALDKHFIDKPRGPSHVDADKVTMQVEGTR